MSDIPLEKAMVLWRPIPGHHIPVLVVPHGQDDQRFIASSGACNRDFQQAGTKERLSKILQLFVTITVTDGVMPSDVHDAFKVIPEYRALFQF